MEHTHYVNGNPLRGPFPGHLESALFAMGCFWGAERIFWETEGVHTTAVGYTGGEMPNPAYEQVCTGSTGHAEAVLVVFDPGRLDYAALLKLFWENHDPTQGMRQGNDIGSHYRSEIFVFDDRQQELAAASRAAYQQSLDAAGHGRPITTAISRAGPFYYAEAVHQQYLAKNPGGYCGLGGTGVRCGAPAS